MVELVYTLQAYLALQIASTLNYRNKMIQMMIG